MDNLSVCCECKKPFGKDNEPGRVCDGTVVCKKCMAKPRKCRVVGLRCHRDDNLCLACGEELDDNVKEFWCGCKVCGRCRAQHTNDHKCPRKDKLVGKCPCCNKKYEVGQSKDLNKMCHVLSCGGEICGACLKDDRMSCKTCGGTFVVQDLHIALRNDAIRHKVLEGHELIVTERVVEAPVVEVPMCTLCKENPNPARYSASFGALKANACEECLEIFKAVTTNIRELVMETPTQSVVRECIGIVNGKIATVEPELPEKMTCAGCDKTTRMDDDNCNIIPFSRGVDMNRVYVCSRCRSRLGAESIDCVIDNAFYDEIQDLLENLDEMEDSLNSEIKEAQNEEYNILRKKEANVNDITLWEKKSTETNEKEFEGVKTSLASLREKMEKKLFNAKSEFVEKRKQCRVNCHLANKIEEAPYATPTAIEKIQDIIDDTLAEQPECDGEYDNSVIVWYPDNMMKDITDKIDEMPAIQ